MTVRQHRKKLTKKLSTEEYYNEKIKVRYPIFTDVPEIFKLTKEDEGKQVWIADKYRTLNTELLKKKDNYAEIKVEGEFRTMYLEELVLHPDEIDKERLEKHGYVIKDGRKNA